MSSLPSLFLLFLIFTAPFALTQDDTSKSKQADTKSQTPRAVVALEHQGIRTCAKSAASMLHFLDENDEAAYLNIWQPTETDKHALLTWLENSDPDAPMIATAGLVPTKDDSCDVIFTQVFVSKESCGKMRETFNEWKYYADIGKFSMYEDPTTPSVNMTLVPIQSGGCLIVKSGTLVMNTSGNPEHSDDTVIDSNEKAAVLALRLYNASLATYATSYPKRGFPKSLEVLGGDSAQEASAEHSKLLEPVRATAPYQSSGYRFTYRSKGNSFYSIVGRPITFGKSGRLSFYTDSSG